MKDKNKTAKAKIEALKAFSAQLKMSDKNDERLSDDDDGMRSCQRCDAEFDLGADEGYKNRWCSKECYEGPKYQK
jgi:hypothetical protein